MRDAMPPMPTPRYPDVPGCEPVWAVGHVRPVHYVSDDGRVVPAPDYATWQGEWLQRRRVDE